MFRIGRFERDWLSSGSISRSMRPQVETTTSCGNRPSAILCASQTWLIADVSAVPVTGQGISESRPVCQIYDRQTFFQIPSRG
jgi:hypothetical protein